MDALVTQMQPGIDIILVPVRMRWSSNAAGHGCDYAWGMDALLINRSRAWPSLCFGQGCLSQRSQSRMDMNLIFLRWMLWSLVGMDVVMFWAWMLSSSGMDAILV